MSGMWNADNAFLVLKRLLAEQLRPRKDARKRTLLDPLCAEDAVRLLHRLARRDDACDALADRLVRLYTTFVPTESSMQCMSLAQQRIKNGGCIEAYAVCLVWTCMLVAITQLYARECRQQCRVALAQTMTRGKSNSTLAP